MIDSNDVAHSSVKLEFPTADIRVIDPKESDKDRAEVQKTMGTQVLHVSEYPRGLSNLRGLNRMAHSTECA